MSIVANLIDRNHDYAGGNLICDFQIDDDSEFAHVERAALKTAAAGIDCAIVWQRSDDGQVAYWGPTGARFRPYWYKQA